MNETVVVVYTSGAASPLELAADAEGYDLLFAVPVDELTDGLADLLAVIGEVVDVTDEVAGAAVLEARRPAGIVAFSDRDLPLTQRLASRLGLRYHSASAVLAATDKHVQRQRLREGGLRVPRFRLLTGPDQAVEALAAVGAPAVLKPVRGAASRQTYRLDTPQDAVRYAADAFASGDADQFVVEEMLVGCPSVAGPGLGDYVSVEILLWRGTVACQVLNSRLPLLEPFREQGFFVPGLLPASVEAEVHRIAAAACHALGLLDGWVDVELKLTADGPVVIEVNARLGGYVAVLLHRSFGVEAVRLAFGVAVGRRPEVSLGEPAAAAFCYQILPPVGDWRLASWGNVEHLTERPDVLSVVLTAEPGDRVDWRLGSQGTLGVVEGSAERPEAVLTAVRAIERAIADQVVFSRE
ncbi:ATP-grasp domain-containing protein [Streptomyces brevispora]|uniref:ATP-grasp domain-containing protein n=1 Tax=Streptomyces brevispora TaxID=887462 RepID=UPI002E2ED6A2|nr:ATP-grasp domain-containing protein [Streptomyces brevispora]